MAKKTRIIEYDVLRVILTILVVFGHSLYLSFSTTNGNLDYNYAINNLSESSKNIYNKLDLFARWIYSFHMPAFFMLSGSVFSIERNKYKSFNYLITNKFNRLLVPYFLVGCFYMIPIKFFSGFYKSNLKDILLVYSSYFSFNLSESGQLWFIMSLLSIFIFFYIFNYAFVSNEHNIKKYYVIVILFLINFLFYKNMDLYFITKFAINFRIETYFIYFSIGYMFEFYRDKLNEYIFTYKSISNIIMLIFLIISIVNVKYGNQNNNLSLVIYPTLFIYILSFKMSKKNKIINSDWYKYISKKAFDMYLYHDPINFIILYISSNFFSFRFFSSQYGIILYYLSRSIFNILVCIFLGFIFSKIYNKK